MVNRSAIHNTEKYVLPVVTGLHLLLSEVLRPLVHNQIWKCCNQWDSFGGMNSVFRTVVIPVEHIDDHKSFLESVQTVSKWHNFNCLSYNVPSNWT